MKRHFVRAEELEMGFDGVVAQEYASSTMRIRYKLQCISLTSACLILLSRTKIANYQIVSKFSIKNTAGFLGCRTKKRTVYIAIM